MYNTWFVKQNKFKLLTIFNPAVALITLALLSGCSDRPDHGPAIIEESEGGHEVLEREFYECAPGESLNENPENFVQYRPNDNTTADYQQTQVEQQFPHLYSSISKAFPLRGSWRQSKAEILDLVDRQIWSPEQRRVVPLLSYFDMALLINIAGRSDKTGDNKSAQRMQVLVRQSSDNNINNWKRLQVWPISSGIPCGKKIATFTGVYKLDPQRMFSSYFSNTFDDAEMYETQFLYHRYQDGSTTGVAIHGTYLTKKLGRQDSGGCIRVYRDNSKCLFETITGRLSKACLAGTRLDYWGKVPSLLPRNGEADPDFLSSGMLEVNGYRVLVALFNDPNDNL